MSILKKISALTKMVFSGSRWMRGDRRLMAVSLMVGKRCWRGEK